MNQKIQVPGRFEVSSRNNRHRHEVRAGLSFYVENGAHHDIGGKPQVIARSKNRIATLGLDVARDISELEQAHVHAVPAK